MVVSPDSDDLHVRVLDTARKEAVIGSAVIRISDIVKMPNMELVTQVKSAHNYPQNRIKSIQITHF